jgi:HlyD family secretion protein
MVGVVQPKNTVSICARVSLPVVELPFSEGDRVAKGNAKSGTSPSVLVRLDDSELQTALKSAEVRRDAQAAEIEVAQVRLAAQAAQMAAQQIGLGEAERDWGRYRQLMASKDTSEAAADEARCKYERAKAAYQAALKEQQASEASLTVMRKNLAAAEVEVERARQGVAAATVTSPIDGVVTRVYIRVGEVANYSNTILMEVADMDHPVLIARVDEQSISKVWVGQKAKVRLKGYGNEVFAGKVERIALVSSEAKDGTTHFRTEISLDTGGRMIPAGLSGEARVEYVAQGDSGQGRHTAG